MGGEKKAFEEASAESPQLAMSSSPQGSAEAPHAAMDVTCVLDVSGSMQGEKLELLKRAVRFIIEDLKATDRLSLVTFNHEAQRQTHLTKMDDSGKDAAMQALMRLCA